MASDGKCHAKGRCFMMFHHDSNTWRGTSANARRSLDGRKYETVLCQNCVRYPLKPRSNTGIYGDTPRHIVVAEVVDGECVGAFRCASARASGINFQACSFNHSDISPSLESINCERSVSDYRTRRDELCQTFESQTHECSVRYIPSIGWPGNTTPLTHGYPSGLPF
jgi:hypothetical protein